MRTLKLEEIAPYYPYELKAIDYDNNACNIIALYDDIVMVRYDLNVGDYELGFDEIKPILRPLSDLFNDNLNPIPVNELKSKYGWDYLFYNVYKKKEPFNVNALSYACLVKLFEWHFDVFSLIDAGLAIDINTISHE